MNSPKNVINELARMRVRFADVADAYVQMPLHSQYNAYRMRDLQVALVLVEDAGWSMITDLSGDWLRPLLALNPTPGLAHQAERGERTVNGKSLLAEQYIELWRGTTALTFQQAAQMGLSLTLQVEAPIAELERALGHFYEHSRAWLVPETAQHERARWSIPVDSPAGLHAWVELEYQRENVTVVLTGNMNSTAGVEALPKPVGVMSQSETLDLFEEVVA
jgi:hypothetical protein